MRNTEESTQTLYLSDEQKQAAQKLLKVYLDQSFYSIDIVKFLEEAKGQYILQSNCDRESITTKFDFKDSLGQMWATEDILEALIDFMKQLNNVQPSKS